MVRKELTCLMNQKLRDIGRFHNLLAEEHDSCGIIAVLENDGQPKRDNMLDTIDALIKMEHRSGFIEEEGDGCGILTDIPRMLWAQKLTAAQQNGELAYDPHFVVGHFFIPRDTDTENAKEQVQHTLQKAGLKVLLTETNEVNSDVLGPNGRRDEPEFLQVAMKAKDGTADLPDQLFELTIELERDYPVQVASLSNTTVIYKVMGAANILPKYFKDLTKSEFQTRVTIGHNRYSTNTLSNFFRVQPFSLLGHNGEINTVRKLQDEAKMIDVPLAEGASDSQDLNRVVESLIHRHGFSLFEAMELVFPPIIHEIKHLPEQLQDLYVYYRQTWGHYAQGPAGIVSRYGDECVFSVDALGLRPLWHVTTERTTYFSSEQGIVSVSQMVSEPKPLAPGEKIGIKLTDEGLKLYGHHELQREICERAKKRATFQGFKQYLFSNEVSETENVQEVEKVTNQQYSAFGWDREHIQLVQQMADTGSEPIRSLGHDGPLAAMSKNRQNIADFIKESVAVVTNPAIDREREMEHFSTRTVIGSRPKLYEKETEQSVRIELPSPILVEGNLAHDVCIEKQTLSCEQLVNLFAKDDLVEVLPMMFTRGTSIPAALDQLAEKAIKAVENGKALLLLDDTGCHENDQLYLDPMLAVSKVDQTLKDTNVPKGEENLRRRASLVVRSGAIRCLHDIAIAVGLGADAVSPYLMFATLVGKEGKSAVSLFDALNKGLEKVISTIGIHELRGYARLFSSIGLHPEIGDVLNIVNFCGSEKSSFNWENLYKDAEARYEDYRNEKIRPSRPFHFFARLWKSLNEVAQNAIPYYQYSEKLQEQEIADPVSLRHVADFDYDTANNETGGPIEPDQVDIGVGEHDLPLIISSMSFGSQNEIAFRAYAEAATRLNMVSLNGEGGEIKDMLGQYPRNRGQQIASGRFGVNVELANSSNLLEIKIGQGAKPGEGGHLPGKKVSAKVAEARNATPGTDLISPSNNHDIYSIEDLAQIIYELKTANKDARVIVKVPIVPNIGTIAVGIAKAGADIITLSGFDGGTGAARVHALQHVGLPVEIGVKAAHTSLVEAGLRHKVEIWADGGLKSGIDVVKMTLLGANRVGFGTLAMMAIGCTACRGCHLDTCHVGIATQIESEAEAEEHGLRRFVPRVYDTSVHNLVSLFGAIGDEIRQITAKLGFKRTQDMVGRSDLLKQARLLEQLDLSDMLAPAADTWRELECEAAAANLVRERVLVAAGAEAETRFADTLTFSEPVTQMYDNIGSAERVLGSTISGARVRGRLDGSYVNSEEVSLNFNGGSVPGNGLAAFNAEGVNITVNGGGQDGVGKTAFGGRVAIMKAPGAHRQFINGSVGKSFCYGAQKGLFIVQGNADSRAGIRLSGADVIIAGELTEKLQDELGGLGARANIKGFAFEYMTNGRAVVFGDPGPWICSGMTGGRVYQKLSPELGLDEAAIMRRLANGAKVDLEPLDETGDRDLRELLEAYHQELLKSGQFETADRIEKLLQDPAKHFVQIIPKSEQTDPNIATE